MKLSKDFILFIVILIWIPKIVFAQSFVEIKDTTLFHNGGTFKIPIYGNFDLANVNDLSITLEFNYQLLYIKGVEGGSQFIINDSNPSYTINSADYAHSTIQISTNRINLTNNGILANLLVEPLAGPDSIAILNPIEIQINGVTQPQIALKEGKINIGLPVYETINEGISQIYPNPFFEEGTISFYIKEPTKVTFKIYSMLGRLVSLIPGNGLVNYIFYDKNGNEITDFTNYTFIRGFYKVKINTIPWMFAAGNYFIVMETKLGTYHSNFIHLK